MEKQKVIIYNDKDANSVAILYPAAECLKTHTIEEIAIKDVPHGRPFKIVDLDDLPAVELEAWEVDDADLTDGVGGPLSVFENDINQIPTPSINANELLLNTNIQHPPVE